jgi:hypothetical protein
MKRLYLGLAVAGALLPYAFFMPWLLEHGPNVRLLVTELFATSLGAFFGADVLISAIVLVVFIRRDAARRRLPRPWLPIAATCLIGVSCGLPLFLYQREAARVGEA